MSNNENKKENKKLTGNIVFLPTMGYSQENEPSVNNIWQNEMNHFQNPGYCGMEIFVNENINLFKLTLCMETMCTSLIFY